ncbi:MAG: hypothetical protein R3B96_15575 [Pirellulaceae bacterium]
MACYLDAEPFTVEEWEAIRGRWHNPRSPTIPSSLVQEQAQALMAALKSDDEAGWDRLIQAIHADQDHLICMVISPDGRGVNFTADVERLQSDRHELLTQLDVQLDEAATLRLPTNVPDNCCLGSILFTAVGDSFHR